MMLRTIGRNKILGVLITFLAHCSCNLPILGVLNPNFPFISRNIWGAGTPSTPYGSDAVKLLKVHFLTGVNICLYFLRGLRERFSILIIRGRILCMNKYELFPADFWAQASKLQKNFIVFQIDQEKNTVRARQ